MKPGKKPFVSKVCPVCGIDKPRSEYYKKLDTVSHKCKPCSLEVQRKIQDRYIGKYIERANEWRRKRYKAEKEFRDRIADQKKARYDERKHLINEARRYRWANDPNHPAKINPRRGGVSLRTPPWADTKAISAVYRDCPDGLEVDHVIPLKGLIDGRPVSGLHVHWNLQYLSKTENCKKKNRISESDLA